MSEQDSSSTHPRFLGIYRLLPRLHEQAAWTGADEQAVQRHFARLQTGAIEGSVFLAGRTLEANDKTFGIVVFRAADENEARAFMASDPGVLADVMSWELHPFRVAVMGRGSAF